MEPKKKRGRPKKVVQPDSPMDYPAIAKKALDENRGAIESLRDYDEGKKEISTATIDKKFAEPKYKMILTLGDEVYEGEGPTPLEALRSIPKPVKITTKARLDVTYGALKKQMLYMPFMARRLFYPLAQPTQAKRIVMLMK